MKIGKMEDFTIDQFAGSMALILGSIGGLLMIIWKTSKPRNELTDV